MEMSGDSAEVPSGAILAALKMIEVTGEDLESAATSAGEVAALLETWGIPVLTQAFGLLIYEAMSAIRPAEGEPDRLHMVVPAVLTRLGSAGWTKPFLPTMAGVLTAAALGGDIWQWRAGLGPLAGGETAAWCLTAWLLFDFVDGLVYEEPGGFARETARIVTRAAGGGDLGEHDPLR
jgi:hypothetical protein